MGFRDSVLVTIAVAKSPRDLVLAMCAYCVKNRIVPSSSAEENSENFKDLSRHDVRPIPGSIKNVTVA